VIAAHEQRDHAVGTVDQQRLDELRRR
jgi:hypothetical protein